MLGLGIATLTAANGAVPLRIGNVAGVDVAGLMIDAGPVNSPALTQVGSALEKNGNRDSPGGASATDPTTLQDVFFRIGGAHAGRATTNLEVNSSNVILDDI